MFGGVAAMLEIARSIRPGRASRPNSLRLVDALMKANKDFELLIVPNAFHPVEAFPYFHRRRWDFFVRELLGKTPPVAYQMEAFE